jgi:hemolysin activation/secretion protein
MGYQQRGWIWGIITFFTALVSPACAQTPIDPNRDRFPQQLPTPTPLPAAPTAPTPTPNPELGSPEDAKQVSIRSIRVMGSTVLKPQAWDAIVRSLTGKTVTIGDLKATADRLTQLYLDRGEITSRVVLLPPTDGNITFQAIEGRLERVDILGLTKLDPNYVRDRIALAAGTPLNVGKLEAQLRLLRADPLFANIEASLKAGTGIGKSILTVRATEADPLDVHLTADNYSPPSVGSERIGTAIEYRNLSGRGDSANLIYNHSLAGGTDIFDLSYKIPLNPLQGTFQARIAPSSNQIIIAPFDRLGFRAKSQVYELSYRQPFTRTLQEEFALSWGASLQKGETFIGNNPAPLSIGADLQGISQTTVLKFGQDYVFRDVNGAWGLRSLLNFGIGMLGATTNPEPIPDGRFFSWQGQIQRVQVLNPDRLLIAQLDAQLTPNSLLPLHQFTIGGGQSVRGFRQNVRAGDNGVRLSLEDRRTVQRNAAGSPTLTLAPFLDAGWVWNQANNPNQLPNQNFLAGVGVGAIWEPISHLSLRVDYGLPLVNLRDRGNNLQDSGIYFNIDYSGF